MTERERLSELVEAGIAKSDFHRKVATQVADYLLANGVRLPVTCRECVHYCLRDAADGKYCEILRYESPIESGWCCYGERREDGT